MRILISLVYILFCFYINAQTTSSIDFTISEISKVTIPQKSSTINCIYKDNKNNFWIGTDLCLLKYEKGEIDNSTIINGSVNTIAEGGSVRWLGTYNGLAELQDDRIVNKYFLDKTVKETSFFDESQCLITSLVCEDNIVPYWGTSKGDVFRIIKTRKRETIDKTRRPPVESNVKSLAFHKQGNAMSEKSILLAATPIGLYSINWRMGNRKSIGNMRSANKVMYFKSRNSFFVLGTDENYRSRLGEYKWLEDDFIYHRLDSIPQDSGLILRDFIKDNSDRIWITSDKGLIIYNPEQGTSDWKTYIGKDSIKIRNIERIALEDDKQIWVSGVGEDVGLYRIKLDVKEVYCGINNGIVRINFMANSANCRNESESDVRMKEVADYLRKNKKHKIVLASGSEREQLSRQRVNLLRLRLIKYGVENTQILTTKERFDIYSTDVHIVFKCPT